MSEWPQFWTTLLPVMSPAIPFRSQEGYPLNGNFPRAHRTVETSWLADGSEHCYADHEEFEPSAVELTAAQLRHGVQLFFWSVRLETTT
jgi:hypothetical protein